MAEGTTIFNGLKFWLSRKIPSRSKFVDDIEVSNNSYGAYRANGIVEAWRHRCSSGEAGRYAHCGSFTERQPSAEQVSLS